MQNEVLVQLLSWSSKIGGCHLNTLGSVLLQFQILVFPMFYAGVEPILEQHFRSTTMPLNLVIYLP